MIIIIKWLGGEFSKQIYVANFEMSVLPSRYMEIIFPYIVTNESLYK